MAWADNSSSTYADRNRSTSSTRHGEQSSRYGRDSGDRYRDRDSRFGDRDNQRDVAIDETTRLIASNKVEGTAVYDRDGERIVSIHNFMVGKRSGKVEYAVLTFGGFLGMGNNYYPLPWSMLNYDTRKGGYVVDIDEEDLDRAPSFRKGQEPNYDDEDYGRDVYGYYGAPF